MYGSPCPHAAPRAMPPARTAVAMHSTATRLDRIGGVYSDLAEPHAAELDVSVRLGRRAVVHELESHGAHVRGRGDLELAFEELPIGGDVHLVHALGSGEPHARRFTVLRLSAHLPDDLVLAGRRRRHHERERAVP